MSESKGMFVRLPRDVVVAIRVDAARQDKPLWVWVLEAATAKLPTDVQKDIAPAD